MYGIVYSGHSREDMMPRSYLGGNQPHRRNVHVSKGEQPSLGVEYRDLSEPEAPPAPEAEPVPSPEPEPVEE